MFSKSQKTIINIDDKNHLNWKLCLKNELGKISSTNIEINCKSLDLYCSDILELIEISDQYNCKVMSFFSTSIKTIVSSKALGYTAYFITDSYSNNTLNKNKNNLNQAKIEFHQGTVRSGEYIDSPGDLLILGDVNPGAIVSANGNIFIWGRLLGIAHAGKEGNAQAKISALQLRPVQLRIASKIARGPQEKPQIGLAEQARIDHEKIIIYPLESI